MQFGLQTQIRYFQQLLHQQLFCRNHEIQLLGWSALNIKTYPYLYLKCGATSPLGKRIPALIKKARAASLLAVEAFLVASNLSCLLLSNKSIFYLLILMIQLSFCKDYASECNESLLSNCRAQLIFCKDTLFF